ncbi:MAG: type VI secretion system accessory protein TagJ [Paracoccaceae bacterium]
MNAEDFLKNGDIDGALAALQDDVRKNPSVARFRIFLFQLLCVLGDWKRAITQLKVCGELDPIAVPMAQTYREAIICEVYREKVFAGEKDPLVFGEPQEWVAHLIEALKLLAAGKTAEAASLRDRAFAAAPAIAGTLNSDAFEWIADADMRLGPVLELIVNGRYFWMPFSAIYEIKADAPEDLRDYVWMPVNVTLRNGGDVVGLVPTRYSGTATAGDASAKLSRTTEWNDAGDGAFVGTGQRLLATDGGDLALLDLRHLTLGEPPDAAVSGSGDG